MEGTYIRTNKGYIFYNLSSKQISGLKLLSQQYGSIVKHSKNIIDLIKVGDLIKFRNKLHNSLENEEMIIHVFNNDTLEEIKTAIKNKEIELLSILTKEQYNQNCYRLEE